MSMPLPDFTLALILTSLMDVIDWLVNLPVEIFHGYGSLLRWAADSAQSLFDKYGYIVIFLGTLSENTLLVGLIVPGALVVILAGLAAHDGAISVPLAIVIGVAGTILGDTISYFMGRYGWSRFGNSQVLSQLNEKVREPLLRRGVTFILFYHFAGYTRVFGPTSAGLLRMPFRSWAPADYIGATLWICGYMAAGYGLGAVGFTLDSSDRYFKLLEWGLLVLMGTWVYFLVKAHTDLFSEDSQHQQESAETADTVTRE